MQFVLLFAISSLLIVTTDCYQSCVGYTHTYKCGWWKTKRCHEPRCHGTGTFTCTCPGTGSNIQFSISCHNSGGCRAVNNPTCSKYINCAVCSSVGEWQGGCASCKAGFQLVNGFCHQDFNECASRSTNICDQQCTNTHGSYYCSCSAGFRLEANKYGCERLRCDQPPKLEGGSIVLTNDSLFESYAKYSCNFPLVLVGNAVRRCLINSAGLYWDGTQPTCVDPCFYPTSDSQETTALLPVTSQNDVTNLGNILLKLTDTTTVDPSGSGSNDSNADERVSQFTTDSNGPSPADERVSQTTSTVATTRLSVASPVEIRRRCGSPGINAEQCKQLGCCEKRPGKCFFTKEHPYVVYHGERPTSNASLSLGRTTLSEYTAAGCDIICQNTSWCKSFAIRRTNTDAVAHQVCYLQELTRAQMIAGSNVVPDKNFDLMEPIQASQNIADNNIIKTLMLYVGCYEDQATEPGFNQVWSYDINSPERCISTCRQQGFTIAALRNGIECYCDVVDTLSYRSTSESCTKLCSGDSRVTCGGNSSSSVYKVPSDSRYIGCYNDRSDNEDFNKSLWTKWSNHSASDCINDCLNLGFTYAAMQNGSRCYCGNEFGRHGSVHFDICDIKCSEKIRESCGGTTHNAVYATELGVSLSARKDHLVKHIYLPENEDYGRFIDIPFMLYSEFHYLKSFTTARFVLRVTDSVVTPSEDETCSTDCYKACGSISPYDTVGLQYKGADQTLRFFHINLADLMKFVGSDALRVYVYAQTVVINSDLEFPFSLQVHTRQLILDRYKARTLRISGNAPNLRINFQEPKTFGVTTDALFQKQSLMCARILIETRQQNNINTGWAILYDLAHTQHSTSVESSAWTNSLRMFNGFLSGIDRQKVHFVPYYTKSYFAEILRLYYERLTLYKNDFDKLLDSSLSAVDYARNAEEMITIYSTTSVAESKTAFDAVLFAIKESSATYRRLEKDYDIAASKVTKTGDTLVSGRKRFFGIIKGIVKVVGSIAKFIGRKRREANARREAEKAKREAEEAARQLQQELNIQLKNFAQNVGRVQETVDQLHRFAEVAQTIGRELGDSDTLYDFSSYMDDVELTAEMRKNAVHWKLLKNNIEVILSHPNVFKTAGAGEYMRLAMDMCHWGEAMSNSAIEHSELLRDAIQKRYMQISKQRQKEKYDIYISRLKNESMSRQQMTAAMVEQLHDVRIDLTNVLFSFCQAYFYENMKECKEEYKPAFGGSLSQLLLKINSVLMDSLFVSNAPSTVNRRIIVKDRAGECLDATECPLKAFQETGVMYFKLPVEHTGFRGFSKYRVSEIVLEFVGARRSDYTSNELLRVHIESSGIFNGKDGNEIFNFVTRPLSLSFEYDVETNDVSIRADVYAPYRSTVQHITPFTTWIIRLSEYSRDIDLTGLTAVKMQFKGSATSYQMHSLLAGQTKPKRPDNRLGSVQSYQELVQLEYQEDQMKFGGALHDDGDQPSSAVEENGKERFANIDGSYKT